MQVGHKVSVNIEDEMRKSYMDYAMSVIVGRALPDVRDGLKPVHRRVLFAMSELGNDWNKPYKKSARVVGDVIGKYHPHGDTAVYDTIVRMAQSFSLRDPLVDGQGNFGSIDGDAAAAMRYTEVRMSRLAHEVMADLEKETVDFGPNYDDSLTEPLVLPCKVPNLLVNGAEGIAVGMATKIPPHNLGEIVGALLAIIDRPELSFDELLELVPGPDFPTGALLLGREGIREAYSTGRGILQVRGRAVIEKSARGNKESIVITEIPFQVNKARLVEKIADLVKEKKIEGISDLRDESDREGMRVVLDLRREADANAILAALYKLTPLQNSFGVIMLAIVGGRPKVLSLREVLDHFLAHRRDVVLRRTAFDLKKAEARAHILEGLCIALDNLDEVISIIRAAKDQETARTKLVRRFSLSELQAQAILDMRLHRLTGLERKKIADELKAVRAMIAEFNKILGSETELMRVIREELVALREQFATARRTEITDASGKIVAQDLVVEEENVITLTCGGYVKRTSLSAYRTAVRSKGAAPLEGDAIEQLFVAASKACLLVFTSIGKVHWLRVAELPIAGHTARGKAIINLLPALEKNEKPLCILPVRDLAETGRYVVLATRDGLIKRTELSAFANVRAGGIAAIEFEDGDTLIGARLSNNESDLVLLSSDGQAIRFEEDQVRPMGRTAKGVRGIALAKGQQVISLEVVPASSPGAVVTATHSGFVKRTALAEFPRQGRGGKGVVAVRITDKTGPLAAARLSGEDDGLILVTEAGRYVRLKGTDIPAQGRSTSGSRLLPEEAAGDQIAALARLEE